MVIQNKQTNSQYKNSRIPYILNLSNARTSYHKKTTKVVTFCQNMYIGIGIFIII